MKLQQIERVIHRALGMAMLSVASLIVASGSAGAQEFAPKPGQRVVLITGSTGGLGRETALALAREGDHVIVHGRNEERGNALVAEINSEGKGSARFYRADFGSLDEVRDLATSVLADYERLNVLVNNAGIFNPQQDQRRLSEDGYELHFQVNYLAGYLLTEMLTPLLEAGAPSRVINVASAQAPLDFDNLMLETGYSGMQAYLQSKLAQIMMTFSLADALYVRGITINALHPSAFMNTDMVVEAGYTPESSVETGRDALLHLINDDVGTGKYFYVFEEDTVIDQAYDEDAVAQLIKISDDLVAESLSQEN
jgi:NAD(P)-dependent dehydrogenase (short-subunit alcohol dehydrogenase family)